MRGKQKFKALTASAVTTKAVKVEPKISLRDKKMALLTARYVYYLTHKRIGLEDILDRLSAEFFISTLRIADLLVEHTGLINNLRRKPPEVSWYKQQWSHLIW